MKCRTSLEEDKVTSLGEAPDFASEVQRVAAELLGNESLPDQQPLMDAGLDSLAAVEFRTLLSKQFPMCDIPSTCLFDYPTITAISQYLSANIAPRATPHAKGTATPIGEPSDFATQVQRVAAELLGNELLVGHQPLMDVGLDLFATVEF
jgi:aryl carrier-like protein